MLSWLDPMGLASGAGSPTDFICRKGTPFEAMTRHATKYPYGFLTEVFLSRKANARKSFALPLVSPIPSWPSLSSLQRLTDETDVTDPVQMAYQAGNPWLRPKLVWSRCSLWVPQALPGKQLKSHEAGSFVIWNYTNWQIQGGQNEIPPWFKETSWWWACIFYQVLRLCYPQIRSQILKYIWNNKFIPVYNHFIKFEVN